MLQPVLYKSAGVWQSTNLTAGFKYASTNLPAPHGSSERSCDTVEPITFMNDFLAVRVLFTQLGFSVHDHRMPIAAQNVDGVALAWTFQNNLI